MEAYRSRVTGGWSILFLIVTLVITPIVSPDAAILFDLHGRDASTQQVFATLSPGVLQGSELHHDGESLFHGNRSDADMSIRRFGFAPFS